MEIFEQVTKLLKDMETREKRSKVDRQLVEGSILTDLITRYNQYVRDRQWDAAHDCLLHISRLVVAMLAE